MKLTIDADALLRLVRRDEQRFRATIFRRDAREVGVAFLLSLYFAYHSLRHHDWTDGLVGAACFGVGAFMVVDRLLQRRKQPVSNNSLKVCLETSLAQVKHQIWLLKNVLWWYLLPIGVALAISTGVSTWRAQHGGMAAVMTWGALVLFFFLLYWGIYWLNQFAVRKNLEPRRHELETLLASLN